MMDDAQLLELLKLMLQSINEEWLDQSNSAIKLSTKSKLSDAYNDFCITKLHDIFEWLAKHRSDISAIKILYSTKKRVTSDMKQAIDLFIDKICQEKAWSNLRESLSFGDMFLNT